MKGELIVTKLNYQIFRFGLIVERFCNIADIFALCWNSNITLLGHF